MNSDKINTRILLIYWALPFILIEFCLSISALAQYSPPERLVSTQINTGETNSLLFSFNADAFFINNEYFAKEVKGYTLPGYFLQPALTYQYRESMKIKAGVHLQQFAGDRGYRVASPIFRLQYSISPRLDLVLGTLYGTSQHGLLEPLYQPDLYFTRPLESGLQFLYSSSHLKSDTWMNWEKYIEPGDPFQESFTAGNSTLLELTKPDAKFKLVLPLQLVATHLGGQINTSDEPVQTLVNLATGFECSSRLPSKNPGWIGIKAYFAGFADLSPNPSLDYKKGHAFYPVAFLETGSWHFSSGIWLPTRFTSAKGEPLFLSNHYAGSEPRLWTSRIWYSKKVLEVLHLGFGAATFYNLAESRLDYTIGLHMVTRGRFTLKRNLFMN
jgi:hypothetical protein